MRLTDKTGRWDYGETWIGRKKNYNVRINCSAYCSAYPLLKEKYWYYSLRKDQYAYNSLWDELKYTSKEECVSAAEKKIDELTKTASEVQINGRTENEMAHEDNNCC